MIQSLNPRIRGLILDLDGVLWKDETPIVDAPQVFEKIRSSGMRFILATNNATRNVEQYQQKLARFGVKVDASEIINSGMAVAFLLSQRFPSGGPVYIVGEDGVRTALQEKGFYPAEKDVIAVVAGWDRAINFAKLTQATLLIRSGVPFYGTNPDRTFPTPQGLIPGAGAILAAIEAATDIKPILGGKPAPAMMNLAMQRLQTSPAETLAIGDRLETDILGGANAGCRTALVLSGVATLKDLEYFQPKPDLVAEDLAHLIGEA
jgi:4-nitrophenyl phosphatase